MEKISMHDRALAQLEKNGTLTKGQFFNLTGSCCLNEYIRILRQQGHNIVTEKDAHNKPCRYVLVKEEATTVKNG
ncbi:MAG: hypothetical protein H7282_04875 [Cytophagaceae bacterium]|nr:hypothetical protein [Cytophagaceae bacterium]